MGELQTYQGRVRTKDNRCVSSPSGDCCCGGGGTIESACAQCNLSGSGGLIPANIKITISGATSSDLNGTYILSHVPQTPVGNNCFYEYISPTALTSCNLTHFRAYFSSMNFSPVIILEIYIPSPSTIRCVYRYAWGAGNIQNCITWTPVTMAIEAPITTCGSGQCNATTVTAERA